MAWRIDGTDLRKGFEVRSKLSEITKGLRLYEKVSVIFLLCPESQTGLQVMESILQEPNKKSQNDLFYKWIKEIVIFKSDDWRDALAELLTIIQNFRLAKILNYSKVELLEKFKPKNNLKSYHICNLKKVLYNLCEQLTRDKFTSLVELIENEHDLRKRTCDLNEKCLEYKLLVWSENKIFNCERNGEVNTNALVNSLKSLGHIEIASDIEVTAEKVASQLQRRKASAIIDLNVPEYYPIIDQNNIGYCVIINEKNFTSSLFTSRWGTGMDVERLVEVFTAFGFDIRVHHDLTHDELTTTLFSYTKLIKENHSCFVLIILSHGSENVIYTSDSIPVSMDSIEMIFQAEFCPNLIGKPKIFIIQSCQGQKWQKLLTISDESSIESDAPEMPQVNSLHKYPVKGPQKGDSMIAWSTVQGFASFRDKYNGSWYIEELCKELWKFGDVTDLVEILTRVNNNLRSKVYGDQFMVPCLLLSLRAKVKFPVLNENLAKGKRLVVERLIFDKYFREFLQTSDCIERLSAIIGK